MTSEPETPAASSTHGRTRRGRISRAGTGTRSATAITSQYDTAVGSISTSCARISGFVESAVAHQMTSGTAARHLLQPMSRRMKQVLADAALEAVFAAARRPPGNEDSLIADGSSLGGLSRSFATAPAGTTFRRRLANNPASA